MKKYILLLLLMVPFKVYGEEAKNITGNSSYTLNNLRITKISDDNFKTYNTIKPDQELVIESGENVSHVYIVFELSSKSGTLKTDNEEIVIGQNNFLHEYHKLTIPSNKLTFKFNEEVKISDIYVYGEGDKPKEVQDWKRETSTDLMIFSTHADDEQLFFAGVMPTYINQGKKVHVVYLARHDVGGYYNPSRMHEQLNGLWTLGVTDYPTFGLIPDAYSTSLDVARQQAKQAGFTEEDIIKFDVTEIRKYKPKVILGHDEKGEYGHGQHQLNTFTLKTAVKEAENNEYVTDELEPVKIYKVYLHLYDDANKTILDYDIPLEKYDGKTAYQVSKEGYSKHLSQQYTWFTNWLNGKNSSYTSATQIDKYNPAYWGLYYTSVGDDINKNDLFENIPEEKEETKEKKTEPTKVTEVRYYRKKFNRFILKTNIILISFILLCLSLIILIKGKKKRTK